MSALRFFGVLVLALCAFAGAFLLAYAAILCGWIVYADYSGALGGADGSASAVAFRWAPIGGVLAGALCAASLLRLGIPARNGPKRKISDAKPATLEATPETDIDKRLAEHGALLRELHALTRSHAFTVVESTPQSGRSGSGLKASERRVA